MRKFDMKYHLKEGFHSIFTHGLMSFAAVCMIMACLLIMGSFSLVAVNLDNTLGSLEADNEYIVYIDESLTGEEALSLQVRICAVPGVADSTFVTRDEALERYKELYTTEENYALFEALDGDVLRHRYEVHVTDLELMADAVAQTETIEGVAWVRWEQEISDGMVALRNVATAVAFVLIGLLVLVSLFIIANTIKLATFHRREEIAIMKMCGATNWFIRWPFIFEAMILGLFGAILAFLIQWGIYEAIVGAVDTIGGLNLVVLVPFGDMALYVAGIFLGSGLLIGALGSVFAIRKFLMV